MFREMRRSAQRLPEKEAWELLKNGSDGVLALLGDGGYPYSVPLNYVLMENSVYFHCALKGHKMDAVNQCGKASFCVVEKGAVVAPLRATDYRSVIAFGRIRIVTEEPLKRKALTALVKKYSAAFWDEGMKEIENAWQQTAVLELKIEYLSGKKAAEAVTSFMEEKETACEPTPRKL